MESIELVIKILEEDYHFIKRQVADGITNPLKICIAKGNPLPKGHGDLIDVRELVKGRVSNDPIVILANNAEIIIGADKTENEGENDQR